MKNQSGDDKAINDTASFENDMKTGPGDNFSNSLIDNVVYVKELEKKNLEETNVNDTEQKFDEEEKMKKNEMVSIYINFYFWKNRHSFFFK
jgi:hypothetical protein